MCAHGQMRMTSSPHTPHGLFGARFRFHRYLRWTRRDKELRGLIHRERTIIGVAMVTERMGNPSRDRRSVIDFPSRVPPATFFFFFFFFSRPRGHNKPTMLQFDMRACIVPRLKRVTGVSDYLISLNPHRFHVNLACLIFHTRNGKCVGGIIHYPRYKSNIYIYEKIYSISRCLSCDIIHFYM